MQVSKDVLEQIRSANPLASVVPERGIELKRKGKTLFGRCPFHSPDKTPSFCVTPGKELFHCFGCGESGDVFGFVVKYDHLTFPEAVLKLARRGALDSKELMRTAPRIVRRTPLEALTPPPELASSGQGNGGGASGRLIVVPPEVVDLYHQTFCESADAQAFLRERRGIADMDLLRALKVGCADGSLLKRIPRKGELRDQLLELGIITKENRELLGGCIIVPIPDPLSGAWTNLYGRGIKTPRHCYLPGPMRGVLNYQAARTSSEVILAESILDALSFHQAGIATAIGIYGVHGFTPEMLDLLKRERVARVILALDNDAAGKKATVTLKEKLTAAGIAVRVASYPAGIKDANALLVSRNGDAAAVFHQLLDEAEPKPAPPAPPKPPSPAPPDPGTSSPATSQPPAASPVPPLREEASPTPGPSSREDGALVLTRDGVSYHARVVSNALGRLRVTVKAFDAGTGAEGRFHADTIDLYASRSRAEFGRRVSKLFGASVDAVESALLALLVEAEKASDAEEKAAEASPVISMSDVERAEALVFLMRPDLLDQVLRDVDALGYVGEETNVKLLYLVATSRKLEDPLSVVIFSQSGAGKSVLTEAIERLMPPEDVVLFTRLTPQSLYYTEPGYLDRKLVIIEERYGSTEADYSIRVLQSRKKLSVAAPIKDPATGNLRTKTFQVEARASFIEATTASQVNHENATRCFELMMDESEKQTGRIHERQRLLRTEAGLALRRAAEAITRRHWNAQRLLEPLPVVIPFADQLSFPSSWMRTRRDHSRFLNLIEVSAFLHQHQRQRKDGAIVASVDDYAAAYALAAQVLAETLTDLKKPLREALTRIQALSSKGDGTVTRREIREALNEPDSTVRGWLHELVELEYLEAEASKGGAGKATRYRVTARGGPRKELLLGLLTPEDLRQRLAGRS